MDWYGEFDENNVLVTRSSDPATDWPLLPVGMMPGDTLNNDGTFTRPTVPPTPDQVNRVRDSRIEAGVAFTLSDASVIAITGRQQDKDVLLARRMIAREMDAAGITDAVLVYRDRDNVNHTLTPQQTVELVDLGFAWFEAMMVRSWEMKDGGPYITNDGDEVTGIPSDLDDDRHWPEP